MRGRRRRVVGLGGVIRCIDDILSARCERGAPINSIDKVFNDPQVKHLGIAQSIETIPFGKTELVGQPFNLSRSPSSMKQRPPEKGEHNKEVLLDLGFTDSELNDFESKNII